MDVSRNGTAASPMAAITAATATAALVRMSRRGAIRS